MTPLQEIRTARLVLRLFTLADAPDIQRLANDRDVAGNTLTIPHPYPDGQAEIWLASVEKKLAEGSAAVFAICDPSSGALLGTIGLQIDRDQRRAELGYWMGRDARGQGFASEAARALLDYGFGELGLERIFASHFPWNPASGRVLEKAGMQREGTLRGHVLKNGARVDLHFYGILRAEHPQTSAERERGEREPA